MASIQYVVNATDLASAVFAKIAASADGLDKQLEDLSKRVATPEVDLKDAKFTAGMLAAAKRIDKLSAAMAEPGVDLSDTKFQAEILKINAQLDRLDGRRVTATVKVNVDRSFMSRLRGLFGGGGGAAGGAAAGGGFAGLIRGLPGAAGAAPPAAQGIGIGLAALLGAVLTPALLPALLGGGVGALGVAGGVAVGAKDRAALQALQKQLAGVTGSTASANARRAALQNQIGAFRQAHGPQLAFGQAAAGLLPAAESTFFGALTARPVTMGPGGPVRGQSFLQGLIPIFRQIEGFTRSLQPMLGDLFRASLPYLKMFVGFLEQATKTLLPVFTNLLKEMTPFLPVIGQGLMDIVKGFAGFLNALGPSGMRASARIFVVLAEGMAAVLVALGHTINWLAENVPTWMRKITNEFRVVRHETAVIFDGIRHDIAHVWDQIFQNSIGMVIRLVHNVETQYNSLRHGLAFTFDTIRHDIARAWDVIWNNTVSRVQRGIADVVRWFKLLPGRAINAIQGLGTLLYNFAHMSLTKFWNGLKAVFGDVWNWFKSLPGKLLHAIGIASPPDWAIQAGKHIMGGILKGITSRKNELQTAFRSSVALGGDALANQALARKIFPWGADQWGPFVNLVMAESGFNRFARNPTSGAYGIAQALPPTKYPLAGQAAGGSHAGAQLSWMFNYIAQRYGTPAGAWAHELSAHWYDRGGWLPPGVSMAVNQTGQPERILAPGQGALVQFGDVNIYDTTDTALLQQRISFAITAAGLGS